MWVFKSKIKKINLRRNYKTARVFFKMKTTVSHKFESFWFFFNFQIKLFSYIHSKYIYVFSTNDRYASQNFEDLASVCNYNL